MASSSASGPVSVRYTYTHLHVKVVANDVIYRPDRP